MVATSRKSGKPVRRPLTDVLREFALAGDMPDPDEPAEPPARPQLSGMPSIPLTGQLRWIVPGILCEGLTILAGREKVGKTWLALDFALAVASGGRALQSLACDAGQAVYIDYENGYRRLQARMERIAPGGEYDPDPGKRKDMWRLTWFHGRLPDDLVPEFERWRQKMRDFRLIVFDAGKDLARIAGRGAWTDRGARGAVTALLEGMQTWALKHGVAVLCLARTPRRGPDAASSRIFGVADAVLVLDRTESRATLKVRSRDAAERTVALAFDAGRFSVLGEASEVRYSLQRSMVLEALEALDAPAGPREVADALGLRIANVKKMMFRMARAGELKRRGRGQYLLPQHDCGNESAKWLSPKSPPEKGKAKTLS